MKHTAQVMLLDAVAEPGEHVKVVIHPTRPKANHKTLYIYVNGVTVVRIGYIEADHIEVTQC